MHVINVYFDSFNRPTKLTQLPSLPKKLTQRQQVIPGLCVFKIPWELEFFFF